MPPTLIRGLWRKVFPRKLYLAWRMMWSPSWVNVKLNFILCLINHLILNGVLPVSYLWIFFFRILHFDTFWNLQCWTQMLVFPQVCFRINILRLEIIPNVFQLNTTIIHLRHHQQFKDNFVLWRSNNQTKPKQNHQLIHGMIILVTLIQDSPLLLVFVFQNHVQNRNSKVCLKLEIFNRYGIIPIIWPVKKNIVGILWLLIYLDFLCFLFFFYNCIFLYLFFQI